MNEIFIDKKFRIPRKLKKKIKKIRYVIKYIGNNTLSVIYDEPVNKKIYRKVYMTLKVK